MVEGKYENYLSDFIIEQSHRYNTFINLGANIGYFPCLALNSGINQVVSVEPNLVNFKLLEENISRNKWEYKSIAVNAACGSTHGNMQLYGKNTGASLVPNWEGNAKGSGQSVTIITLDDLLDSVRTFGKQLILIDVEGFEYEVIKGANKAMSQADKITWIIEVSLFRSIGKFEILSPWLREFFDLFLRSGYIVYTWDEGLKKLSQGEVNEYCEGKKIWPALPFVFTTETL